MAQIPTGKPQPVYPPPKSKRLQRAEAAIARLIDEGVVPEPTPEEMEARDELRKEYLEMLESGRPEEVAMLKRLADLSWEFRRAFAISEARTAKNMQVARENSEREEIEEVEYHGRRLLAYPYEPLKNGRKRRAKPLSIIPSIERMELTSTSTGIDWLLARWADVRARLDANGAWELQDLREVFLLAGQHPEDVFRDPDLLRLLAAVYVARGGEGGVQKLLTDWQDLIECWVREEEWHLRTLAKLKPANADSARNLLRAYIDVQEHKLAVERTETDPAAEFRLECAKDIEAVDVSPIGQKLLNWYIALSSESTLVMKALEKFLRGR
jgi:hypothetical protein